MQVSDPHAPKADIIGADGHHWYWSTHCRHAPWPRRKSDEDDRDGHDACQAIELAPGVTRRPAQCKTCGARCICPCHQSPLVSAAE